MNEHDQNISPVRRSGTRPQPGRYLSNSERMRKKKKRRQQQMIRRGITAGVFLGILILVIVLIAKGCSGAADDLAGTWILDSATSYRFEEDGTGAMLLRSSRYGFSYKVKGDRLCIDYEDEILVDGEYTFAVNENTLTLTGGEGTIGGTYELTKINTDE